jgi:hypothetical protein
MTRKRAKTETRAALLREVLRNPSLHPRCALLHLSAGKLRDGGSRLPVSVSVIDYLVIVSPAPGYQHVELAERKDTRIELVGCL